MLLHELVLKLWDGYMTNAMKQIIFFALAIVGCGCASNAIVNLTATSLLDCSINSYQIDFDSIANRDSDHRAQYQRERYFVAG
jgi:hypothetical protein